MDNLLKENEFLIKSVAKKFYNVEKEDLYQAGYVGLLKALKNYDDPNVKFTTYAYKYVFGEMYDLSVKSRNIKLNKTYLQIYKLINQTISKLNQQLNKEVSLKEVSEYLNMDLSELEYVVMISEDMLSLDDEYENIQIGVDNNMDDVILLNDSLNNLDPLSSLVMSYRYLEDKTQSEVAELLGLSQVNVSRIESTSKKKMLEYIS